ncbi:MAG: hypothetical protein JXR59_11270 [Desulfuromonadaceae bacterium]|nr:hypothetical protein [Desulfuromonadaceae bacterium]
MKRNFSYEKRQKELSRQAKKEEKKKRKQSREDLQDPEPQDGPAPTENEIQAPANPSIP